MFLIEVHDSFKAETGDDVTDTVVLSHAVVAREYASQYINDIDLQNMIEHHDDNYRIWKEYKKKGSYDASKFQALLEKIVDWDLFLIFTIIDGSIDGKEPEKIEWFINEVKKYKNTFVDSSWLFDKKG